MRFFVHKNFVCLHWMTIREETVESALIGGLIAVGYAVTLAYRRAMNKMVKKIEKLHEDKFLAKKVLGIVNVPWVTLRIIEPKRFKTLSEYNLPRAHEVRQVHKISNRALVKEEGMSERTVIISPYENVNFRVFYVLPSKHITENQRSLIQAVVNQLETLFLVFTSRYYKTTVG